MSTLDSNLPHTISNSSSSSAQYVNGEYIQDNLDKIVDELCDGTNTDINLDSTEINSLNASKSEANVIGNQSTTTVNALTANVTTLNATSGSSLVPLGAVLPYMGVGSVPTGFLECDGSAISRGTYASLFAVISTSYGAGDGSTTFNIPDLRGYFLRGYDHGAGEDPDAASRTDRGDGTTGDNIGTVQDHGIKDHFHTHRHYIQSYAEDTNDGGSAQSQYSVENWSSDTITTSYDVDANGDSEVGANSSDGTSITDSNPTTETRPKNISVMYIMRVS